MATGSNSTQQVFDGVMQEFKASLDKDELYNEILKTTTVEEVYDMTDKLQQEQAKHGHLRHLSKIQPFLEGLNGYANVIEVFMQAKSEVLALIWGPIKLIIQWASVLKQSFDAVINLIAEIGWLLPEFKQVSSLFDANKQIKDVLALFFKDLLAFYLIALRFFSLSRWKYVFESLWPRQRKKIQVVIDHINRLALLMRNEVRLEHIQAEYNHRLRALEHFERTERSYQRQEYNSIKADISPPTYDESLNLLLGRICQGTGKWLLNDSDFKKWRDTSESSTHLLWLQGIPGAGKTYLSATIITETRYHGRTIYVFLSHIARRTISALSILQSLIFQLASDDDAVQESLIQSSREHLKSSIDAAINLLITLLHCAGPTYIVVDGLDEIEEIERSRLLPQLLKVSGTCKEAKVLISSRPEFDITKTLQDKAAIIRVDHKNSGSIQTYVTQQMQKWFIERQFLQEARSQIEGLLAPIAWKSKGMFLYARIILSDIEDLEVHEICRELRALPDSLEEAYGRIFHRINRWKPTLREKARKILGWIGCSPIPLAIQELEQALTIDPTDLRASNRILSSLNISKICGPIIEVINGYVHFVHFTVKEYLFNPQVANYLDDREATLSLAVCCVAYLCQSHHDPDISDEELHENSIAGAYRLHQYSTSVWLELVKLSVRSMSSDLLPDNLVAILRTLMLERENVDYNKSTSSASNPDLMIFKSDKNDLYQLLCRADQFSQNFSKTELRMLKGNYWTSLDPLTLSNTSVRVFKQIDALLECQDEVLCRDFLKEKPCHCASIRWHHGQWPFKCEFLSCVFRRSGFDNRSFTVSHIRHHDKPWKCSFPGCEFAQGGFLSRKMRDDHFDSFHQEQRSKGMTKFADLDQNDLQPLFFDLILTDKVEVVKFILPQFGELKESIQNQLRKLAATSGSLAMLELIRPVKWSFNGPEKDTLFGFAQTAIEARNLEICLYLITELRPLEYRKHNLANLLPSILASDSEELFQVWADHANVSDNLGYDSHLGSAIINGRGKGIHPSALAFATPNIIKATAGQSWREEMLLSLWMKLDICRRCGPKSSGVILGFVAKTTSSIRLANFLLENGAAVDPPGDDGHSRRIMTPLHWAARQTTAQAAELMMLLLLKGADPDPPMTTYKGKRANPIGDEKGAKGISKWLNMTWDEAVAHARNERQKLGVLEHIPTIR